MSTTSKCTFKALQTSFQSLRYPSASTCATTATTDRPSYFVCMARDPRQTSPLTMHPQNAKLRPNRLTPSTHLSDTLPYHQSIDETKLYEPTSYGPTTTYFYCCQCLMGPQVYNHNPACSNCYHHTCSRCRYRK